MGPSIPPETCRACLEHSPEGTLLTDAFDYESAYDDISNTEENHRCYLDVYKFVAEINADPVVHLVSAVPAFLGLPERICDECEAQLVAAYIFRQKTIRSEKALADVINSYEANKKPGFDQVLIKVKEEIVGAPEAEVECKTEILEKPDKSEHSQRAKRSRTSRSKPSSRKAIKNKKVVAEKIKVSKRATDTNAVSEDDESEGVANDVTIQSNEDSDIDETADASDKVAKSKYGPSDKKQCEDCGKFICSRYLANHRRQHKYGEKQPFACEICGSRYTLAANLGHHMRVHTNDKRFACPHCDEKFMYWATRRYHILRHHTGEAKFTCEYCGMKFYVSSHYNVHIQRHRGVTPFACDKCDRRFTTPSSLKNHQLTHTDEKNFKCEICHKCYKSNRSMLAHVRTLHQMEKNYVCPVCQQAFSQNHVMRSHIQRHHPEYELPPAGTVMNLKTIERIKDMVSVAPIEDRADQEAKKKIVSTRLI